MKELSVFIDESGDFGAYDPRAPFYIIGMVLHDQSKDISASIKRFDNSLRQIDFTPNYIHVGPLIRREFEYRNLSIPERVRILRRLVNFASSIDFSYQAFVAEKKHIEDDVELVALLAKQVSNFIKQNYPFFMSYDKVKVYYDDGQVEVHKIITSVFTTLLGNVEFKKAYQKDYRLAQIADLICTTTLTEIKMNTKTLSRSEKRLLGDEREIRKKLVKPLERKKFRS